MPHPTDLSTNAFAPTAGQDNAAPVPSINVEDGVQRLLGNRAAYLSLLGIFQDLYKDGIPTVQRLYANGETVQLLQQLHGLKSASGQIGASALQETCRQLEGLLKQDPSADMSAHWADFERQLAEVLASIPQIIAAE